MFRIKNDEYNTVQLLPDFESNSMSGRKQKMSPAPVSSDILDARKRKRRIIIAAIAALLILAAVLGKLIYNQYLAPPTLESYLQCFENEKYDQCADIAAELSGDSDFVEGIRRPVLTEADSAYKKYIDGEAASDETLNRLDTLNKASAGIFDRSISEQADTVRQFDDLYASINSVNELVKKGTMDDLSEAYNILAGAPAKGAELGTDPSWMLTGVIKDNINALKYYLFTRYADEVQQGRSGYAFIEESAGFITSYVQDPDLINYLSVMADLRKGWHSPIYAEDAARTAAAAAEAAWKEQKTT